MARLAWLRSVRAVFEPRPRHRAAEPAQRYSLPDRTLSVHHRLIGHLVLADDRLQRDFRRRPERALLPSNLRVFRYVNDALPGKLFFDP